MMTIPSDETKIAVLGQKVDDLIYDVREVKKLVGDKIATKEYVDDRLNPIKKLVYWGLGLLGTLFTGSVLVIIGLLLK